MTAKFTSAEAANVQKYMQTKLGNPAITLRARAQNADSLEVLLNGEFLGVVYKDVEDGETSYDFNMAILEIDLAA